MEEQESIVFAEYKFEVSGETDLLAMVIPILEEAQDDPLAMEEVGVFAWDQALRTVPGRMVELKSVEFHPEATAPDYIRMAVVDTEAGA